MSTYPPTKTTDKFPHDDNSAHGAKSAAQLCYRELGIILGIMEKCFVDDYSKDRLLRIIKDIVLRADQTLLQSRKHS